MEPTRQQLEQWDHEHVWHPFTPMQAYAAEKPLIIAGATAAFSSISTGGSISTACRRYGATSTAIGCPQLDAAVRSQLDAVAHSTLLGISNVPAIELARRLAELRRRVCRMYSSPTMAPRRSKSR